MEKQPSSTFPRYGWISSKALSFGGAAAAKRPDRPCCRCTYKRLTKWSILVKRPHACRQGRDDRSSGETRTTLRSPWTYLRTVMKGYVGTHGCTIMISHTPARGNPISVTHSPGPLSTGTVGSAPNNYPISSRVSAFVLRCPHRPPSPSAAQSSAHLHSRRRHDTCLSVNSKRWRWRWRWRWRVLHVRSARAACIY